MCHEVERQRWRWSNKMRCDNQPGQTKGEQEANDPATAKQTTVVMISRRKCGRRGEDLPIVGNYDGNNA